MPRTLRTLLAAALALAGPLVLATGASALIPLDTCVYDAPSKVVSVFFPGGANQFRTVAREDDGNAILYNSSPCEGATVKNTDTINVYAFDGAQTLTVDVSSGPFGPGAADEGSGTREIEWNVDLGAGTNGLTLQGGPADERFTFQGGGGVKLNGDGDVDVDLADIDLRYAYGGGGNDVIGATDATAEVGLYGGPGDDTLTGGGRDDTLQGEGDRDTLRGGAGGDDLEGGGAADDLRGGADNDSLYGGPGDDMADGGPGGDSMYAEGDPDGADRFIGGPGSDDQVSYYQRTTSVDADLDGDAGDGAAGEGDRIAADVEDLIGGEGADTLIGDESDNDIEGRDGADTLKGGGGDDYVNGEGGNDDVFGGADADTLYDGEGDDTVHADAGNDAMYPTVAVDGDDDYHGGPGRDFLYYNQRATAVWFRIGGANEGGVGESDSIATDIEGGSGGSAGDTMTGTAGANYLGGAAGADTIDGGAGRDTLYGYAGNDDITGGDGGDSVYAMEDNDTLHLNDNGTDYADCGTGFDTATDTDIYDVTLTGCEAT